MLFVSVGPVPLGIGQRTAVVVVVTQLGSTVGELGLRVAARGAFDHPVEDTRLRRGVTCTEQLAGVVRAVHVGVTAVW